MAVLASSCLGDKSQDDYVRERVAQQQAKIESIQGTYRGTLVAKDTGAPLGTLQMDLRASVDVQNSYDNTTSQPKAVAKGTLYYSGLSTSQINFDQGYYDDNSGTLDIRIPVVDVMGASRIIDLHANLEGDTLSGDLSEETLGGFAAEFIISKNAPASTSQTLVVGRISRLTVAPQQFDGKVDGSDTDFQMVIQYKEKSSSQLFLNLFLPERSVNVTVIYNHHPFTFSDALLNETQNTLRATSDTKDPYSSLSIHVELNCNRTIHAATQSQWDCWMKGWGDAYHIVVTTHPSETHLGKE
jgi:hypothetical protein